MSIDGDIAWAQSIREEEQAQYKRAFDAGHREGFECGRDFARYKIKALEDHITILTRLIDVGPWECIAYRVLRDTLNADEIKYVLLENQLPDEIDRRMESLMRELDMSQPG